MVVVLKNTGFFYFCFVFCCFVVVFFGCCCITQAEQRVNLKLLGLRSSLLARDRGASNGAGSLLGEQDVVDVGQDTTLGNGDTDQELVQLLVVADSQLHVAGVDTVLLVVAGSVASKLENLGSQVLKDGSEVDGRASTNAGSKVAVAEMAVNTANGELEACAGGARLGLARRGLGLATLATTARCCGSSRHVCD